MSFVSQFFLSLGTYSVRCLVCFFEKSLTFRFNFIGHLVHKVSALPIKLFIFLQELVALPLRFNLFQVGILELSIDTTLPRIDGIENRLIKKVLHQPYQDEKVEHLSLI